MNSRPDDLYGEQIRQIDSLMAMSAAGTVVSSLVLTFVLRDQVAPVALASWLIFLLVLTLCRHPLIYRKIPPLSKPGSRRLGHFFMITAMLFGMVWGATGAFLFPQGSLAHQVFLAFVLGGMVAGAVGLYSVLFKLFCVFTIPALSPLIIRFFWIGDEIHVAMATMCFFFMAIMFSTAKRINGTAINNIHLNLKNRGLIVSLSAAKERAEQVNEELQAEINERRKAETKMLRYRDRLQEMIEERTSELSLANTQLQKILVEQKRTQAHLLHQEKMASIGQLAAGVAHEINNPIGFVASNIRSLNKYMRRLMEFVDIQAEVLGSLQALDRVKKIVQNLKSFSRLDAAEEKVADINECLETTLGIVWNELKYKSTVHKEYGDLPLTRCYPQQLGQVFMNLLVNAAQAIDQQGKITLKTWQDHETIKVSISDTGSGIPADQINRIFRQTV